jgi:hypothetical protein
MQDLPQCAERLVFSLAFSDRLTISPVSSKAVGIAVGILFASWCLCVQSIGVCCWFVENVQRSLDRQGRG